MVDSNLVENFERLFRGRKDSWGLGKGGVVRAELDLIPYTRHLRGKDRGIGIFPMLDSNEVWFAAIDLDEPNFELAQAFQRLIPGTSWIERSRSGNAHVWVFFESPCPAWAARTILRGATEALGRKDVEVFPKQDQLREGMVGNYINLPYHGDDRPILQWHDPLDDPVSPPYPLEGFLGAALASLQDPDSWTRRARALGGLPPAERDETSEWGEAPMLHECALYIIDGVKSGDRPLLPGARHQVLFHLAKQLLNYRDMTQDEARRILGEVNDAAPKPLPDSEVERSFRNAVQGRFTSTGCDDPLMASYVRPDCPIASR